MEAVPCARTSANQALVPQLSKRVWRAGCGKWRWALGGAVVAVISGRLLTHNNSRSKLAETVIVRWAEADGRETMKQSDLAAWLESEGIHVNKDVLQNMTNHIDEDGNGFNGDELLRVADLFENFPQASETLKDMGDDDLVAKLAPRKREDLACVCFVAVAILLLLLQADNMEMMTPSLQISIALLEQQKAQIQKIVKQQNVQIASAAREANKEREAELRESNCKWQVQLDLLQQDRDECQNELKRTRDRAQRKSAELRQKRAEDRAHLIQGSPIFREAMAHVGDGEIQESTDFCFGFEVGRVRGQNLSGFEGTFSAFCPEFRRGGEHFIGAHLWDGRMVVYRSKGKQVGEAGGEGTACEFVDAQTKEKVVCKAYKKNARIQMASEWACLMGMPPCDNVVRIRQVIQVDQRVYMFMDYLEGQDLFSACTVGGDVMADERECAIVCEGAAKGVAHLHRHNIIHGDVKPENFVISPTHDHVTILDFGYSVRTSRVDKSRLPDGITPGELYPDPSPRTDKICQPEHLGHNGNENEKWAAFRNANGIENRHMWVSKEGDIWRLGATFFIVLAKVFPFAASKRFECAWHRQSVSGRSPEATALLESIFKACPASRPDIEEIVNHQWFRQQIASAAQ